MGSKELLSIVGMDSGRQIFSEIVKTNVVQIVMRWILVFSMYSLETQTQELL